MIKSTTVSQERTGNYIRQIKGSFIFKGLAVAASFLAFPLMIRYLGQEQFGVWSTLLSIVSWVVFFDLGIGNGLRNKLAEALAKDELATAGRYIASAYSLIGLISLFLFAVTAIATFAIPWQTVFNTQIVSEVLLRYTVLIAAFFIFLNFWISLVNQVLNALQKTSVVVFGQFLSNALALALVFALTKTADASLFYMAIVYGTSLIISNGLLSLWFYRRRSELAPTLFLDRQHVPPLLSLGMQFFVIQIAALVIFTTDKILIAQLFGPQYVTQYDIVFKLFSIITLIHALISAPLWSSYTDAFHKGDFAWIKWALKKQLLAFGIISVAVISMMLLAKPLIALWIGSDLDVSIGLIVSMGAFVLVATWNNVFAHFVNGIGELKVQLSSAIIAALINVPLAIILTKHFAFGVEGIVWATCISLLFFAVLGPIQGYIVLSNREAKC